MTESRNVIILIVEGVSDEYVLSLFNKVYEQKFNFKIVHSDITSDKDINSKNIIKKVESLYEEELAEARKIIKIKKKDILGIILITDLDGAFIDDSMVKYDETKVNIDYKDTGIYTNDIKKVKNRNYHKRENIFKLTSCSKINKKPFRILYNSVNLEKLCFDKVVEEDVEKEDLSHAFYSKYRENPHLFLEFLNGFEIKENISGSEVKENISGFEKYKLSWEYIFNDGLKSLQRGTNLYLMSDIIEDFKEFHK